MKLFTPALRAVRSFRILTTLASLSLLLIVNGCCHHGCGLCHKNRGPCGNQAFYPPPASPCDPCGQAPVMAPASPCPTCGPGGGTTFDGGGSAPVFGPTGAIMPGAPVASGYAPVQTASFPMNPLPTY